MPTSSPVTPQPSDADTSDNNNNGGDSGSGGGTGTDTDTDTDTTDGTDGGSSFFGDTISAMTDNSMSIYL